MTPLLEARDVSRRFRGPRRFGIGRRASVTAVDRVSLGLEAGARLGLVGESGSGKSTLARMLVGLDRPSSGQVLWQGRPTDGLSASQWRALWRRVQFVFQDPHGALNPRHRVGHSLAAPLAGLGRGERRRRVALLLERVGLEPDHARRFPHELSGGQAQRVVLARALAPEPDLLVLDEPLSALDVSVQAQILALLKAIADDSGLGYLFISHDLAVVEQLCSWVAVMREGRLVESGATGQVLGAPEHRYTRALMDAVPRLPSREPETAP